MAKIKKKITKTEKPVETPVETPVEETAENEYMNEAEAEVLTKDGEAIAELNGEVSSERMHKIVEHLQESFDIKNKGFELTGYNDKGNKVEVTLTNIDYEVKFTLKLTALNNIR